jgi:uncharacterized protein (TIGR03437 family)
MISLFAGNGIELGCCFPEILPTGDNGPATKALLHAPSGLTFDDQGNVFVAEVYGGRIRKVRPDGIITTVQHAVTPNGLALDAAGNFYTSVNAGNNILKISPDGNQSLIAGGGKTGETDDCPALAAALGNVFSVALDGQGGLVFSNGASVRRLTPATIFPSRVFDLASHLPQFLAPGELISIEWTGMGPAEAVTASPDADGLYPTQLAGTTVLFDGIASPLLYVDSKEVRTIVPFRIGDSTSLQVVYNGTRSNSIALATEQASPAIFTTGGGRGQAMALNEDGTENSTADPALTGSIVSLLGTGGGALRPAARDGAVAATEPVPLIWPVQAMVGGNPATVEYAGTAPGMVSGIMQVKVRIPNTRVDSDRRAPILAVPVVLAIHGAVSQSGVTVAVR